MTEPTLTGAAELAADARQLLAELERDIPGAASLTAECRPPTDVLETAKTVEIVVDLPGVPSDSLRILVRRQTVLIVGVKAATPADRQSRFHVAERSYGRFARAVNVAPAVDPTRAHATTERGQLRVVLPRIDDRRGQLFRIPVTAR